MLTHIAMIAYQNEEIMTQINGQIKIEKNEGSQVLFVDLSLRHNIWVVADLVRLSPLLVCLDEGIELAYSSISIGLD